MVPVSPWQTLYALTWLVFLEFLLAMMPGAPGWLTYGHIVLGVGIALLAANNARALTATAVPGRVKRTARSTMQLSIAIAILGTLLVFDLGASWTIAFGITVYGVILFLHVVLALAILAQAAAVGIAYDMWEEKEFLAETAPGEVPAMPQPERKPGSRARG